MRFEEEFLVLGQCARCERCERRHPAAALVEGLCAWCARFKHGVIVHATVRPARAVFPEQAVMAYDPAPCGEPLRDFAEHLPSGSVR